MTTLGGVFHALPFLITDRNTAIVIALIVVLAELIAISVIRKRFLRVSLRNSFIQVTPPWAASSSLRWGYCWAAPVENIDPTATPA